MRVLQMMDSQVLPQGLHPRVKEVLVDIQIQKEEAPVVADFQDNNHSKLGG
jgi:hypothetical protein